MAGCLLVAFCKIPQSNKSTNAEMWISAFVLLLKFGSAAFDESQQFGGHFQARRRGIGHWFAEHHAHDSDHLGPDATVEITINPR
jgi:hypothetical protein